MAVSTSVVSSVVSPVVNPVISAIRRNFTTIAAAGSQNWTVPVLSLTSFEIVLDVSGSPQDDRKIFAMRDSNGDVFNIGSSNIGATNTIRVFHAGLGGQSDLVGTTVALNNKINNIMIKWEVGITTLSIFVNGALDTSVVVAANFLPDFSLLTGIAIGKEAGLAGFFSGIIANTKIFNAGTLSRFYKIDEDWTGPSTVLHDSSGNNQHGVAVNITSADAEFFTQQSNGDFLGVELVVNGGFDTDTDWIKESEWSISNGSATMAPTALFNTIRQNVGFVEDKTYSLKLDVTAVTGLMKAMQIANTGTTNLALFTFNTQGHISEVVTSAGGSGRTSIGFARDSGASSCTIDNVSVKQLLELA